MSTPSNRSSLHSTSAPSIPPRTPSSTLPTTPIFDRFTDPFRYDSSTTTTPTPATPRVSQPSTVSPVIQQHQSTGSQDLHGLFGPYGIRTPTTPGCTSTRYQPCRFVNCSTFSLDSEYSTAGESFYGDDGDDDGDDNASELESEDRMPGTGRGSTISSPPSSAGPRTPAWSQHTLEVRASRSSSHRHSCHSQSQKHFSSPARPSPAPSLWCGDANGSPVSPSPIRSLRFLPADSVPASTLRQQPSATSSWLDKPSTTSKKSVAPLDVSPPLPRPVRPAYPSRAAHGAPSVIPTELSVFDPAPKQTLLADIEYITGKKLHFPFLARMAKGKGEKARRSSKKDKQGQGRSSMGDEWSLDDVPLAKHQMEQEREVEVEKRERKSSEGWREKYARREYWI